MSLAAQLTALVGAAEPTFRGPTIDYHALAPEIVLSAAIVVLVLLDSIKLERAKAFMPVVANLALLGALIPLLTLAYDGGTRILFDGSYVVGPMPLLLKAMFIVSTYVVVLLSMNYVAEGDYWESEYYTLLLSSVLGMVVMASSRDLIGIFVALELLSIPAYMLASWRKSDVRSNEAGMKYYLMGVFASAVLLYGMSLVYGIGGSTKLFELGRAIAEAPDKGVPVVTLALLFVVVGFAFKVSAVPFHVWAPDTYEGAPTPVTAFLSVSSKAAGFVGLIVLVFIAFPMAQDVYRPFLWVMAALTMTVGNVVALKQKNIVRMLAYSSVSQGGFILMPLAIAFTDGNQGTSLRAIVVYLIIYAATNLGAFAVIIAVARKTRSGQISSFGGLFSYAPGLTVLMTIFLASLAGIPPLGGWYAKFGAFKAAVDAAGGWGYGIAIVGAVNAVIATAYYIVVMREMWMKPVPDGDVTPIKVPASLQAALAICGVATLAFGVVPGIIAKAGQITDLFGALRP